MKFNLPKGCAFSNIAIIPARTDPRNTQLIRARTLVQNAVDFCNNLGIEPYVSTNSEAIATDIENAVVIMRPESLCTDEIGTLAVLKHAIEGLKKTDYWNLLLEPTSPWRYKDDVQRCLDEAHSDRWCVATAEPVKTVRSATARFNGATWLLGPLDSWFSSENIQLVFTDYRPNIKHAVDFHIAANLLTWHRKFHEEWLQHYMDSDRSQTPSSPQTSQTEPESSAD